MSTATLSKRTNSGGLKTNQTVKAAPLIPFPVDNSDEIIQQFLADHPDYSVEQFRKAAIIWLRIFFTQDTDWFSEWGEKLLNETGRVRLSHAQNARIYGFLLSYPDLDYLDLQEAAIISEFAYHDGIGEWFTDFGAGAVDENEGSGTE